jgi:hypothetical protein
MKAQLWASKTRMVPGNWNTEHWYYLKLEDETEIRATTKERAAELAVELGLQVVDLTIRPEEV